MIFYYYYLIEQFRVMLYVIPAVLFAIVCHEYAHGWMSDRLGDPTPRMNGRLSLNPINDYSISGHLPVSSQMPVKPDSQGFSGVSRLRGTSRNLPFPRES